MDGIIRSSFSSIVEEVVLATGPHSSFCGSSQCSLIGNVTGEVDEVEDEEKRDEGEEERSCQTTQSLS